ncbi:MAG: hypothetical protein QF535_04670, partial [Anaerolineales bacterium]|nr:hypothetical protein [Anaerolineales bacterium]
EDHTNINFYVEDISSNPAVETIAAVHPPVRLDTVAAIFDTSNPWHGSVPEVDNEYVVVVFKEPVFGNGVLGSAVSNLSLTFDRNGGTATNAAITGIANNTIGGALAVGDSIMRVLLTITGVPDGLERIKIAPGNGASVYDRAGNATAANVETDWISLKDQTAPVGVIVTDISGNEPAAGGKYVGISNPQLTIKASDAYRNADNEITVSVTSADSLIYIKEAGQLAFTPDIRISGNNSDVVVTLASAADGAGLPEGIYDELDFVFVDYGIIVEANPLGADYCTPDNLCAEGEADADDIKKDCLPGLRKFERSSGQAVPGLSFPVGFNPAWDPCYDPSFNESAAVEAADFIIDLTPPEISSTIIADDNSYIDVTFNDDLLFNSSSGSGALAADDFNLTFAQNGGTATAATISSIKKNNNISEGLASVLSGGETVIRIFLNIIGTPGGVETITIVPTDASSIFDAAGHNASTTQTNNVVNLVDKIAPVLTDPITISGNNVGGVNYVRDNTPGISIQANDALSNADNEITVSATSTINGNPGTVVFLSEDNGTSFATSVDIIGNNTPVALIIARLADGSELPDGSYSAVVITVTDEAGNSRSVTIDPFEIDATPPEFSSVVIIDPDSPTNSRVKVAFDSDVYKRNTGSGELGIGDQVYFQTTVTGGIAALPSFAQNILEHNPSTRDTVVLSINPSDADGTEQLSITYDDPVLAPGDFEGVFDRAGNPLTNPPVTLTVNEDTLWDETSPALIDNNNDSNWVF